MIPPTLAHPQENLRQLEAALRELFSVVVVDQLDPIFLNFTGVKLPCLFRPLARIQAGGTVAFGPLLAFLLALFLPLALLLAVLLALEVPLTLALAFPFPVPLPTLAISLLPLFTGFTIVASVAGRTVFPRSLTLRAGRRRRSGCGAGFAFRRRGLGSGRRVFLAGRRRVGRFRPGGGGRFAVGSAVRRHRGGVHEFGLQTALLFAAMPLVTPVTRKTLAIPFAFARRPARSTLRRGRGVGRLAGGVGRA